MKTLSFSAIVLAVALSGCVKKSVAEHRQFVETAEASTIIAKCGSAGWIVEIDGKRYLDFGNDNIHPIAGTIQEVCGNDSQGTTDSN